jgi:hypothetical protein
MGFAIIVSIVIGVAGLPIHRYNGLSSSAVVWHSAAFSVALSYNQKKAFRTFLFFYLLFL